MEITFNSSIRYDESPNGPTLELQVPSVRAIFDIGIESMDLENQLSLFNGIFHQFFLEEKDSSPFNLILSDKKVNALIAFLLDEQTRESSFVRFTNALRESTKNKIDARVHLLPTTIFDEPEGDFDQSVFSNVILELPNGEEYGVYLDLEPYGKTQLDNIMAARCIFHVAVAMENEPDLVFTEDGLENLKPTLGLIIFPVGKGHPNQAYTLALGKPLSVFGPEVEALERALADESGEYCPAPCGYAVGINGDYNDPQLEIRENDLPIVKSMKRLLKLLNVLVTNDLDLEERLKILNEDFGITSSESLETGFNLIEVVKELVRNEYSHKIGSSPNNPQTEENGREPQKE